MRKAAKILIPVLVVFAIAAFAAWWFLRNDAPKPAALVQRVTSTTSAQAPTSPDGNWKVEKSKDTFAGYRVQEQFAGETIKKTAVGRTGNVTGSISITANQLTAASFTVDMTTLTSNQSKRDQRIKSLGLETNTFRTASFTATVPFNLPETPQLNKKYSLSVPGKLTLHGVTKDVMVTMQARWNGNNIDLAGKTPIAFADYGITAPSVSGFTSVNDHGEMEFQLTLVPAKAR